jgi:hypothetical protein
MWIEDAMLLTGADKTLFVKIVLLVATVVGLLSGVAQFAAQWTRGGWNLLIAAAVVVAFAAGTALIGVIVWNRRRHPVTLPLWALVLTTVVLIAATGATIGLSVGGHGRHPLAHAGTPVPGPDRSPTPGPTASATPTPPSPSAPVGPPTNVLNGGAFFDADGDGTYDGYLTSGIKDGKLERAQLNGWNGGKDDYFPIYLEAPTALPEDCRQHSTTIPTTNGVPSFVGKVVIPDSVTPNQIKACLLTRGAGGPSPKRHWVMINVIDTRRTDDHVSLGVEMTVVDI